jgi:hypothetical protein
MSTCTLLRRLRAAVVLLLSVVGCAAVEPAPKLPDPRVTADGLQAAAAICASRGFSYVVHVDARRYFCLRVNAGNEPEGIPVTTVMMEARP